MDESLYKYQTRVRAQVKRMNALLNTLQNYKGKLNEKESDFNNKAKFLAALEVLTLKGRDRPKNRQVGAWQSKKITPYSVLKNAVKFSKSRLNNPSKQDIALVEQAKALIDEFELEVKKFQSKWQTEIQELN